MKAIEKKNELVRIWSNYLAENKEIATAQGNVIEEFDKKRLAAIEDIKPIILSFLNGSTNVYQFKTAIDSYNKRSNLWGFTAVKGQMFFNQLVKINEEHIEQISTLLKQCITAPGNLQDALAKITAIEGFAEPHFLKAKDKRKAPNPGSSAYFLSYFWQIAQPEKWPIEYTSIIDSFKALGLWVDQPTRARQYEFFYNMNEEVKAVLSAHLGHPVTNWDVEHAFWTFKNYGFVFEKTAVKQEKLTLPATDIAPVEFSVKPSFDYKEFIIPRVAALIDLGNSTNKSAAGKGAEFEKMVSEVFKHLDFDVTYLGQGTGRNPDAIVKYREDNTVFIIDAKAYGNGYSLGLDDRAIKEYINHHCPVLQKEGYKKIGFIIVSNSFKSDLDSFINDITWNTEIKQFILLTSEALLYLLAYKTRDKLSLSQIIECLVSAGNVVDANHVVEVFEEV